MILKQALMFPNQKTLLLPDKKGRGLWVTVPPGVDRYYMVTVSFLGRLALPAVRGALGSLWTPRAWRGGGRSTWPFGSVVDASCPILIRKRRELKAQGTCLLAVCGLAKWDDLWERLTSGLWSYAVPGGCNPGHYCVKLVGTGLSPQGCLFHLEEWWVPRALTYKMWREAHWWLQLMWRSCFLLASSMTEPGCEEGRTGKAGENEIFLFGIHLFWISCHRIV